MLLSREIKWQVQQKMDHTYAEYELMDQPTDRCSLVDFLLQPDQDASSVIANQYAQRKILLLNYEDRHLHYSSTLFRNKNKNKKAGLDY